MISSRITENGKWISQQINKDVHEIFIGNRDSKIKQSYWLNGKLHKIDGPARLDNGFSSHGSPQYWIDGKYYGDYRTPEYKIQAALYKNLINKSDIKKIQDLIDV